MQSLRLVSLVMGVLIIWACGGATPKPQSPKHIRQSTRHLNIAAKLYIKGCYVRALEHYQQAHERFTAADHMMGIGHSLNGLANVYYRMGELPSAVLTYKDAIETYSAMEATEACVRAMCNQAAALLSADRLGEAEKVFKQADDKATNNRVLRALRLKTKAILLMQRQDPEGAEVLLRKALAIAADGEKDQLSSIHYTMGRLFLSRQQPSQAIPHLEQALDLDRTAGAYDDVAHDLEALGRGFAHLAQYEQAIANLKRSIKIYALLGNADKVHQLASVMESHSQLPEHGYKATMHWANQWLSGQKEANLCR